MEPSKHIIRWFESLHEILNAFVFTTVLTDAFIYVFGSDFDYLRAQEV